MLSVLYGEPGQNISIKKAHLYEVVSTGQRWESGAITGIIMKKILVTGGAGYVGHMLTPQLLDAGYAVTVYDAMWYGNDKMPKGNPNFTLVEGDIRDTAKVAKD